jgi:radical SAM family uncharacterized protein/radical SAM-linked protein
MSPKSIQDILPLVEMPSRYMGTEINRIKKKTEEVDLWVALAFPDLYEIGSSHFGIQILYHLLNEQANIFAERVFAPADDMEKKLRAHKIELFSLESRRAIKNFDILGFSLLYELTYTNVLNMLELSNIPFLSSQRNISDPFIIAGGPCTCNPEPMADIFDAMVIGDGEDVLLKMCEAWFDWRKSETDLKNELLEKWADLEGIYVPSLYQFNQNNFYKKDFLKANRINSAPVKRTIVSDLDQTYFPKKPLIPFGKPVHDRLRLEISRGCSRGCRFCQAGMIYRPVRERNPNHLVRQATSALKATGYEDISLLSLSTGDYSCLNYLIKTLMRICQEDYVAVSLPSLRAGTLNSNLMEQIKKVRKTGFTIAPEAGSQRLRNVINKNITEKDILETVQDAFKLGWQVIKLYFMVGLPTETKDDLKAIVDLVKKIRQGAKGNRRKINVSVTTFIPKPHTPFQWEPQISRKRSWEIITFLKDELTMLKGVQFKWQNPDVSFVEGIMARGDRRLLDAIILAHKNGSKFDGWNDFFDFKKWESALKEIGLEYPFFMDRRIDPDVLLPWDHIDSRVKKNYLLSELQKALEGHLTFDCRLSGCHQCGGCDFERLAPIIHAKARLIREDFKANFTRPSVYKKLYGTFQKKGDARFLGHLEMVKIFHRAIKRCGLLTEFSKGFHPMPKMSFDNPLPIGMESHCEHFVISIQSDISSENFKERLNRELPNGLKVVKAGFKKPFKNKRNIKIAEYQIIINDGFFSQNRLHSFVKSETFILEKLTRKGQTKKIDLKSIICNIQIETPIKLNLKLIEGPGKIVRPSEILAHVFEFENEVKVSARVLKLSVYDELEGND